MTLAQLIRAAKHVYLAGNGGSAANAMHVANDLISVGIKAHALTGDISTLTAIGNDFGYGTVFSGQLRVFAEPGDLLIVLSGSGQSANIIHALSAAKDIGIDSVAIIGAYNANTPAENLATYTISQGADMQAAEEAQLVIGHEAWRALKGKV